MIYFIAAYCFIAIASGIAMIQYDTLNDWIASIISGFLWPLILTVRIIRKIDSLLK